MASENFWSIMIYYKIR